MALLVADSFNRANHTSSLGSTDGAGADDPQVWTQNSGGGFGISSNQAYRSAGATFGVASVDVRTGDVEVQVTVSALHTAGNAGLAFRVKDALNFWVFFVNGTTNQVQLLKFVNGSFTTVASSTVTKVAGAVLKVSCAGDQITRYYNGTNLGTSTDATFQTETHHGLWINGTGTAWRLDDFSISGTQAPAATHLLHFELAPDATSTGGAAHMTMGTVGFGPDGGTLTTIGSFVSQPESGNDGVSEWLSVDVDISSLYDPATDLKVLFSAVGAGATGLGDALHLRRVKIVDAAGVTVAEPEYPKGSTYTSAEQDGTGIPFGQMGQDLATGGGSIYNADTGVADSTVDHAWWFFSALAVGGPTVGFIGFGTF